MHIIKNNEVYLSQGKREEFLPQIVRLQCYIIKRESLFYYPFYSEFRVKWGVKKGLRIDTSKRTCFHRRVVVFDEIGIGPQTSSPSPTTS